MRAGRIGRRVAASAAAALLVLGHAWGAQLEQGQSNGPVRTPNNGDLDTATRMGDFAAYFTSISAWLNQKVSRGPDGVSEAALDTLLKDPVFANALAQRRLISKLGVANLSALAKADPDSRAFLAWLLRNTEAMDLYLEGGTPTGIQAREEDRYVLKKESLDIWKSIYQADPDSRHGMYLRLAIATGLNPPPAMGDYSKVAIDPVARFRHFRAAHRNKELFPSFDTLTVWEYSKVVCAAQSDAELTWGREMINTFRPDLRDGEKVVNIVSSVWRRASPVPYTGMQTMLQGGGKCGPRSTFGVFINRAFGIPAIGVAQPSHACVAWRSIGGTWKVGYGRGWNVSRLEGLSGLDFVAGAEARSRAAQFSHVEHLRWIAAALASKEKAAAILGIVQKLAKAEAPSKLNATASERADEADSEPGAGAKAAPAAKAPAVAAGSAGEAFKMLDGRLHIEAASYAKTGGQAHWSPERGVVTQQSVGGGKQVYFPQQMKTCWVEYNIDVPAAGTYGLVLKTAAINGDQQLDVMCGATKLATVAVPMSHGLWVTTQEVELRLEKGTQTLTISVPDMKRGIALKSLEIRSRGSKEMGENSGR